MEKEKKYEEKVIHISRVTKVTKGGNTLRFSALVVIGDREGHVGIGSGKSAEVPDAIVKAVSNAKNNIVKVPIVGTTVPHEFTGKFGAAKVVVKPGQEGTGVIAGGAARSVLEIAGYKDAKAKIIGTNNPRNVVKATLDALLNMRTVEEVAKLRDKEVNEII
ncbi:MAG: 30S ribosomal protein S5 [Clostridium sp.]